MMNETKEIYLDNAATTCVSSAVAQEIAEKMTGCWGNPSSLHKKGLQAKLALEKAAKDVGETLGVSGDTILFTSGGTEGDNLAVLGAAAAKKRRGDHIITTAVEHSAVLASCKHLEEQGFRVTYLQPDRQGHITAEQVMNAVEDRTILVSMMLVNNEVGSIFPVGEAAKAIRRKNKEILIHCDAVQAYGKMPIKLGSGFDVDLLTLSGHKIHAPKGIGALYVKKGVRILPRSYGGSQQRGLRTGTEPVPLACGLAKAAQLASEQLPEKNRHFITLREELLKNTADLENICINSPMDGAPYIVNLSCTGTRSEIMLHFLESRGIYLSSGSACSKGQKSHVLTAMGLDSKIIDSALRISFDESTSLEDIHTLAEILKEGIASIRR